jgi:AcrR family transcriptional regulator
VSRSSGGQTKKGDGYHHGDLRRALIQAGRQVLVERGVDALGLREVARRAEVSPAAPYHHFANKAELVRAIVEDGFETFTQALRAGAAARGASAIERLSGMGLAYVQFAVANPDLFRLLFRPELRDTGGNTASAEAMAKAGLSAYHTFLDCVEATIEEGSVRGSLDDVAIATLSSVHGLATLLVDGPIDFSSRSADQQARVVLRALGEGIAIPSQPRKGEPTPKSR